LIDLVAQVITDIEKFSIIKSDYSQSWKANQHWYFFSYIFRNNDKSRLKRGKIKSYEKLDFEHIIWNI